MRLPFDPMCKREPKDCGYQAFIEPGSGITPDQYVMAEEGTYDPESGLFLCDLCYMKFGMPANPFPQHNWKATPENLVDLLPNIMGDVEWAVRLLRESNTRGEA